MQEKCLKFISYFAIWFAFWTLGSNWISFTGQDSSLLIYWLLITISSLVLFIVATRKVTLLTPIQSNSIISLDEMDILKPKHLPLVPLIVFGLLITAYNYKFQSVWVFFIGFATLASYIYYLLKTTSSPLIAPIKTADTDQKSILEITFVFVLLLALYYFAHQPDIDDSNFINLGIGAFRSEFGVFAKDTMLGDGLSLMHIDFYRVQSYELLHGTLGNIFPWPTIFFAHIALPFISIALLTAVLFLIYKTLLNEYVLVGIISHIILIIISIDGFQSFGVHGIFRLFQGKIVFIQILIPMIVYLGILHYKTSSIMAWLVLFCLQVSSVGMSVNAIYVAPLTLGLGLFPFFLNKPFDIQTIKRIVVTLLTCAYPIMVGLILIDQGIGFSPNKIDLTKVDGLFPVHQIKSTPWSTMFIYFGWNLYGVVLVGLLPLSVYLCSKLIQNSYMKHYFVGIILFVFNPLIWPYYYFVVGALASRIYWSVGFPVIFALGISYLVLGFCNKLKLSFISVNKSALLVVCLLLFIAILDKTVFRESSDIPIDWKLSSYKVNKKSFDLANKVAAKSTQPCTVLVPEEVSPYITIMEDHPYPVAVRMLYLNIYKNKLPSYIFRARLLRSVSSKKIGSVTENEIIDAIDRFNINLVLILKEHVNQNLYDSVLVNQDFMRESWDEHFIYIKHCDLTNE